MKTKLTRAALGACVALLCAGVVAVGAGPTYKQVPTPKTTGSLAVFRDIFVPAQGFTSIGDLPEPAAFALIGSGLVLLGILRRPKIP